MSNSSRDISAALESTRASKIEKIKVEVDKLLLECFLYGDADEGMLNMQEYKGKCEIALKAITDDKSLNQVSKFIIAMMKSVKREVDKSEKNNELLASYASLIHNTLVLCGPDALDNGVLLVIKQMTDFLDSPDIDQYKNLDDAVKKWEEVTEKKLSYYQSAKEFTFNIAYIAVSHLMFGLTKATSLLSVLSFNKIAPTADSLSKTMTTHVATSSKEHKKSEAKKDLKVSIAKLNPHSKSEAKKDAKNNQTQLKLK